ncbi:MULTISPECIES: PAAR-like domain-containing protein [Caballeronia]|jgi:uncharacterized Zn-binding protein involved in type VI secretion|uniref:Uncharacterized protein n=1 Tax=Caballeronia zhejiangensis TaxID=871203 RepID=A0A656QMF0_9BURK|nr:MULTISPECIES: PAAR-like domain-containing protein [Caballeronia]KDR32081.1 hypothetical protein BG60_25945 [Caballeronia zhejiangensis]MCI1045422.1 DUF4150 domain-containing protein [Caballeronia zhejiangensis]MDR5769326.1 DUF4150 domain-containing protein [Caballeronia sp. LZ028]MDR5790246.1 DUF4150 domain-containing protein [Caballeronia sp. LP003]
MTSVGIHPPKTPVTKGSSGTARATLPNMCKMPGPPAPFVPAALPNTAKSGDSPDGYSTSVKIEGDEVAIRGAMFNSFGDMASKGTGGGLLSSNTHGPARFITPGSMTVKIEGKSVHLLAEPMLNNCGPNGSPPNTGATMTGVKQKRSKRPPATQVGPDCGKKKKKKKRKWDDCMCGQVCEMVKAYNQSKSKKARLSDSPSNPGSDHYDAYQASLKQFAKDFADAVTAAAGNPDHPAIKRMFYSPKNVKPPDCQHEKWKQAGGLADPARSGRGAMNPDHMHPASLSGPLTSANMRWADARVNYTVGGSMNRLKPAPKRMKAHPSCNCD